METFTVATAVNEHYVFPMAVMMRSVVQALSVEATVTFRILTVGLSHKSRSALDRSLAGLSAEYEEIVIDPSVLHDLKVDRHVTLETYFRLLLPQYLHDVERVLYLDTDLIACHSVHEIFGEEMLGAHLLAVPHASKRSGFFCSERGVPSYSSLGIPGMTRTFNAGVMLIDLEAWRISDTTRCILQYLRYYREQVLWWDQDGLNAVLYDKWRPLAAKWNVMASHFAEFESWQDSLLDSTTFEFIKQNPGIVHYSNSPKPWSTDYHGPFLEYWYAASEAISQHFEAH